MRILFIGDIVGRPGRLAVARWLPELRAELSVELVVANAENVAGGLGATPDTLKELIRDGIHAFTLGNHTWRKKEMAPAMDSFPSLVRPANYSPGVPGRGATLIHLPDGRKAGISSLLGRIYMEPVVDDPFAAAKREVERLKTETPIVVVDMHAEATSEKAAMGWFLDGRCTAVVGTHTHVTTADETVLPGGTAYITDIGMTGPRDSVIGTDKDLVIKKFVTGMPVTFEVAKGPVVFNAVLIDADEGTGRANSIERIRRVEG